jgi:hypothetical protein
VGVGRTIFWRRFVEVNRPPKPALGVRSSRSPEAAGAGWKTDGQSVNSDPGDLFAAPQILQVLLQLILGRNRHGEIPKQPSAKDLPVNDDDLVVMTNQSAA